MDHQEIVHQIQSCLKGEKEAFSPIIRQYQSRIYRLCHHFLATPQDVEDAAAEIFIKTYRSLHQYNSRNRFLSWISRIAVNHCLEKLRRLKLEHGYYKNVLQKESKPVEEKTPAVHYLKESQIRLVQGAVKELPVKYQVPLILKYEQELSYQEIAASLDLPVNTVASLILRGKRILREKIEKMETSP